MKKIFLLFFIVSISSIGFAQCDGDLDVFGSPGETEFCPGEVLTFQVLNISGAGCPAIASTYFDWNIGSDQDGLGAANQDFTHTAESGNTTIEVDVYNGSVDPGNLLFSQSIEITVLDEIEVSVDLEDGSLACAGSLLNLEATVTGGDGDYTYTWIPDANSSSSNITTVTGSNVGVGDTYTLNIVDGLTCTGSGTSDFEINEPPVLNISASYSFCDGEDAEIDFNTPGNNSYTWRKLPDGSVQNEGNGILDINNIDSSDEGSYELTVTNSSDCFDTMTITISVDEPSTPSLTFDTSFDCSDGFELSAENAQIAMTVSPNGGNYEIDDATPPPGSITGDNLNLGILGIGGPYNISYIVGNGACQNSVSQEFSIFPELIIEGFTTDLSICDGGTIDIEAASASGSADLSSCVWTYGVNQVNSCELFLQNVSSSLDNTTFNINAVDVNGCTSTRGFDLSVDVLVIQITPDLSENGTSQYCVSNAPFNLNGSPAGGDWLVIGGNQNIVSDLGVFNPSLSGAGTFEISYTVGEGSCTITESVDIVVLSLPTLDAIPNQTLCENSPTLNLNDLVSQSDVLFYDDANELFTAGVFDAGILGVGVFTVTAELTNSSGCTSEQSFNIQVFDAFTAAGDPALSICTGGTPTLGLELTNGNVPFTYEWSNGNLLNNANSSTPTLQSGEIQVTTAFNVTITDGNDCVTSAVQTVNVFQQPNQLAISQSPICVGESSCLSVQFLGGVQPATYNWSGGAIQSTLGCDFTTDPITEPTIFNLNLSFPGNTYCNSQSEEINVVLSSTPNPQIQNLPSSVCKGQQLVLFADNIINGSVVSWQVNPLTAVEESSSQGQVYILNVADDFLGDSFQVSVKEEYPSPSTCDWTNVFDIDISSQVAAAPAEIFYSPVNDVLVYNDSGPDCYQWGFFDSIPAPGDPNFIAIPGQTFQSYVPVQYDPDITYWCQAWYGDCGSSPVCANMSIRSTVVNSALPVYSPEFLLYPNPNQGSFRLDVNNLFPNQEYEIKISNAVGQVLEVQSFMTLSKEVHLYLELGNIASGFYHLGIYRNDGLEMIKAFVIDNQ